MASKYRPGNVTGVDPVTKKFVSMTPEQFAAELRRKSYTPPKGLPSAIDRSCKNIVKGAKANVLRTAPIHNAGAHKYIDHEVNSTRTGGGGIVGYNRTYRPARLGNLLEFGGPGINGDPSPAHFDLAYALEAEQQNFVENTLDAAEAYIANRWGYEVGQGYTGPRAPNPGFE